MKRKKFSLGLLLFGFVNFATAHVGDSDVEYYSMMGNMMTGYYGYYGMGFSWLIGLLVIVALVLLIIWLAKQIWGKQ